MPKSIRLEIPDELYTTLRHAADARGVSLSDQILQELQ